MHFSIIQDSQSQFFQSLGDNPQCCSLDFRVGKLRDFLRPYDMQNSAKILSLNTISGQKVSFEKQVRQLDGLPPCPLNFACRFLILIQRTRR